MSKIVLEFDKALTKLAGNAFGKATYIKQIKEVINYNEETVLVFPDRIDRLASSFVQGLFEEIVKQIGISSVPEKIKVQSSIPNLEKFIMDNLE